jgi:hypothetical protein
LENSGDAIAWLAKELNPFSISPSMFCHIATGSLLLSAIGALQRNHEGLRHLARNPRPEPACFGHTTLLRQGGQHWGRRFVSVAAVSKPSAADKTVP